MKPEAQQIAIAEACGWKVDTSPERRRERYDWVVVNPQGFEVYWSGFGPIGDALPDYLNDLNAMHEAEKVLTLKQRDIYIGWLMSMAAWSAVTIAAQRAEAFLRTIGKWEEE